MRAHLNQAISLTLRAQCAILDPSREETLSGNRFNSDGISRAFSGKRVDVYPSARQTPRRRRDGTALGVANSTLGDDASLSRYEIRAFSNTSATPCPEPTHTPSVP